MSNISEKSQEKQVVSDPSIENEEKYEPSALSNVEEKVVDDTLTSSGFENNTLDEEFKCNNILSESVSNGSNGDLVIKVSYWSSRAGTKYL